MQMEEAGEELSDNEDIDDEYEDEDEEEELQMGGWLEEVPDLQMRFMLAMNPQLRSQFGF